MAQVLFQQLFGKSSVAYLVLEKWEQKLPSVTYANPAACAFLDTKEDKLLGKQLFSVFGNLPAEQEEKLKGCFDDLGNGLIAVNTQNRKILLGVSEIAGGAWSCALRDLSNCSRRQEINENPRQKALERALEAATAASQAKSSFLSQMSHDIRTPMNAIIGMTEIALRHENDPVRVKDCLQKIKSASGHMMQLINEVLDMSRIESGKIVLEEEEMDLADFLHGLMAVIRPQADEKGLKVHLEIGKLCSERMKADELRLRQICMNLLSNAVKFTPEGGSVTVWMQVEGRAEKGRFSFRVSDTGPGMSREFMDRLFQPYERERSMTVNKIQGSGLGLSIVKSLTELMGGSVEAESEPGQGASFLVRIPVQLLEEDVEKFSRALQGAAVLVLEPDSGRLAGLVSALDQYGIKWDHAACGNDAVDLLNEAAFSGKDYFALLTAEEIPDIEITQLLPEIRRRMGIDFPMVMMSEHDWSQMEYILKRSGVSEFFPLPVFASRLLALLYSFTEEGKIEIEEKNRPVRRSYQNRRLLLVEDNALNCEIATEILSVSGIQIDTAENGLKAVERFQGMPENYYDLILMDIQMPVMDGLEAARRIRALERKDAGSVPIVAMTANAFVEDVQDSLKAGMDAHISKPLDADQVLHCLDQWAGGD
ncbi:hybrid sensor histidine kinase/response regulator [Cuneatibacter caecimuris]|uniref:Circadian input-output histidine kinase CikA n=1 Tax=Cuneatibacter caecimuris TaxID=1796618 RepID=A0A4Q7NXD3_9FIRM|nr:ATP-binding protein [Cuneatibacter caecimuris]RZS92033.1 signal transduction histidine kinase [Cuneatibacter caecimuris]